MKLQVCLQRLENSLAPKKRRQGLRVVCYGERPVETVCCAKKCCGGEMCGAGVVRDGQRGDTSLVDASFRSPFVASIVSLRKHRVDIV